MAKKMTKAQLADAKRKKHAKELREERALIKELGLKEVFRPKGMVIKRVTRKGVKLKKPRAYKVQKRVVGRLFGIPVQPKNAKRLRVAHKKELKKVTSLAKKDIIVVRKRHAEALARERKLIKELGLREVYRRKGMVLRKVTRGGVRLQRPRAYGTQKRVVGRLFA